MGGVSIKVSGAMFSKFVASLTQPDPLGLRGEYFFGKSNASAVVNHASPDLPMTVVGAPTHGDLYTTVSGGSGYGSHGFDVGMPPPSSDMTMVCLVRKRTAFPAIFATGSPYTGFVDLANVPAFYNSQTGTLVNVADVAVPSSTDFVLLAGVGALGQPGKLYLYSNGVGAVSTAESAGGTARATTNMFIGTTIPAGGIGQIDIAYAAFFDVLKTAAQLDSMYAALRTFFSDRGLTVA